LGDGGCLRGVERLRRGSGGGRLVERIRTSRDQLPTARFSNRRGVSRQRLAVPGAAPVELTGHRPVSVSRPGRSIESRAADHIRKSFTEWTAWVGLLHGPECRRRLRLSVDSTAGPGSVVALAVPVPGGYLERDPYGRGHLPVHRARDFPHRWAGGVGRAAGYPCCSPGDSSDFERYLPFA
jgi:hypothetical protein